MWTTWMSRKEAKLLWHVSWVSKNEKKWPARLWKSVATKSLVVQASLSWMQMPKSSVNSFCHDSDLKTQRHLQRCVFFIAKIKRPAAWQAFLAKHKLVLEHVLVTFPVRNVLTVTVVFPRLGFKEVLVEVFAHRFTNDFISTQALQSVVQVGW